MKNSPFSITNKGILVSLLICNTVAITAGISIFGIDPLKTTELFAIISASIIGLIPLPIFIIILAKKPIGWYKLTREQQNRSNV